MANVAKGAEAFAENFNCQSYNVVCNVTNVTDDSEHER